MYQDQKTIHVGEYKELFCKLPQPIVLFRPEDLSIIAVNEAACNLYGYSEEEFLMLGFEDLVDITRQPAVDIGKKYSNGSFRDSHCTKDGKEIKVFVQISAINFGESNTVVVTINKDIRTGNGKNNPLEFNHDEYILSQITEAVIVFSLEGKVIYWNDGAAKIYGYSSNEAVGKTASEVFQYTSLNDDENQLVRTSLITMGEWRSLDVHRKKDGEKIFVESTSRLMKDEKNSVTGIISLIRNVTDRIKTEEELRRSREELNVILKSVAEGITVQDKNGRVVYANDAAAKICGYPDVKSFLNNESKDLINKFELMDEYGVPFPAENLPGRRALKGEHSASAVIKFRAIDTGKEAWSRIKATPVYDDDGSVRLAINVFNDITEQRNTEQKIRESESRFRLLVEQSPLSKQIISPSGYTIMINKAWQNLFGAGMPELIDYNILEDKQLEESGTLEYIRKAFEGESSFLPPIKYRPERGNVKGKELWLQAYVYPVKNEEGAVKEIVLIHEDITEIKNTQYKLEKEYAFRMSLENAIPEGISVIDHDGKLSYVNPAFCNLVGWSEDELINKYPPFVYWPEEEIESINKIFLSVLHGDIPEKGYELKFVRKNGEKINVHLLVSPLHDAEGKIQGWLASTSDITERKQTEEKITASLREKDILLKEVHHRVKNNMQVIYSLLNLQSNIISDAKALEAFKESQNRIRTMALIHEKLYQSKEISRIDLPSYLDELVTHLSNSYLLNTENVTIELDIPQLEVNIDTAISVGLLVNELVTNSIKYAFPSNSTGIIKLKLSENSKHFTLSVSDNGIGLPENYDFENAKTLGLQLVSTLTEQLSGQVEVNCSNGTEFIITFPHKKAPANSLPV